MENQIKAGVFQKLDKSKLPNLSNLDPSVLEKTDAHDPGGEYSSLYVWNNWNRIQCSCCGREAEMLSHGILFSTQ